MNYLKIIQKNKTRISKKSNNPFLKLFEIIYDYQTDFKFESDKFLFCKFYF